MPTRNVVHFQRTRRIVRPRLNQERVHHRVRSLSQWLGTLLTTLGLLGMGLVLILGSLWWLIPRLYPLAEPTSLLLLTPAEGGRNQRLVYVYADPADDTMTVVSLPPQEMTTVMGGYGNYELGAMHSLLTLEKKTPRFMAAAFGSSLKRSIHHVMVGPPQSELATSQDVAGWLRRMLWQPRLDTKLTLTVWQMYVYAQQRQPSQVTFKTVTTQEEWRKEMTRLVNINRHPGCPVAVVNSTTTSGLATTMAEMLDQSQMTVIKVADTNQPAELSTMYYQAEDMSECQSVIANSQALFPEPIQVSHESAILTQYRAKVVIVIGGDYSSVVSSGSK